MYRKKLSFSSFDRILEWKILSLTQDSIMISSFHISIILIIKYEKTKTIKKLYIYYNIYILKSPIFSH